MKKGVALITLIGVLTVLGYTQVPNKLKYQAVIRNNSGELVSDQSVNVKLIIRDNSTDGTLLFSEEHTKSTNSYGIVDLTIGEGTLLDGSFSEINWGLNDKFISISVDLGDGYIDMGSTQLLTVPFAIYSRSADSSKVAAMAYNANALSSNGVYSTNTDTLFVVKDHDGNVVFTVFPDGAEVIVNEATKGKVGGFAVSGRSPNKAIDLDILKITPDSTRITFNQAAKGKVGGFAVSGRSPNKATSKSLLNLFEDNYFIGHESGINTIGTNNLFLGYETGMLSEEGDDNVMIGSWAGYQNNGNYNVFLGYESGYSNIGGADNRYSHYNTFVGYQSGKGNTIGWNNVFIGYQAGLSSGESTNNVFIGNESGALLSDGSNNVFIGPLSGWKSTVCSNNVFIGNAAGMNNTTGYYNLYVGEGAGAANTDKVGNVFLGNKAGSYYDNGGNNVMIGNGAGYYASNNENVLIGANAGNYADSGNVMIGYSAGVAQNVSNKLYIDNSGTSSPLIYGDFNVDSVSINGNFHVQGNITATGTIVPDYVFESDYELETIEDHANFMWTNKHLPALKSAIEIKEEGRINLNERREQILEELEKAHIYIEQLNNKMTNQQNQVEELRKENKEMKQKLDEILKLLEK